jgi:hypothetical protein
MQSIAHKGHKNPLIQYEKHCFWKYFKAQNKHYEAFFTLEMYGAERAATLSVPMSVRDPVYGRIHGFLVAFVRPGIYGDRKSVLRR